MAPSATSDPFSPEFDERVAQILDHFHVPSMSISVVNGPDTFVKVRQNPLLIFIYRRHSSVVILERLKHGSDQKRSVSGSTV